MNLLIHNYAVLIEWSVCSAIIYHKISSVFLQYIQDSVINATNNWTSLNLIFKNLIYNKQSVNAFQMISVLYIPSNQLLFIPSNQLLFISSNQLLFI